MATRVQNPQSTDPTSPRQHVYLSLPFCVPQSSVVTRTSQTLLSDRPIGRVGRVAGRRENVFDRDRPLGDQITPVAPNDVVRSGDWLIFTGVVTTILDLVKTHRLVPAADMSYKIHPDQFGIRGLIAYDLQ